MKYKKLIKTRKDFVGEEDLTLDHRDGGTLFYQSAKEVTLYPAEGVMRGALIMQVAAPHRYVIFTNTPSIILEARLRIAVTVALRQCSLQVFV